MNEVLDDKRPFFIYRLKTSAFLLKLELSRKYDIFAEEYSAYTRNTSPSTSVYCNHPYPSVHPLASNTIK